MLFIDLEWEHTPLLQNKSAGSALNVHSVLRQMGTPIFTLLKMLMSWIGLSTLSLAIQTTSFMDVSLFLRNGQLGSCTTFHSQEISKYL